MGKNSERKFRNLLGCASCAVALAATISFAGPAYSQVATSTNLPVPNFIDGATLQYNNGVTAQTNAGGLVTNQAILKVAADTGKTLNVDLSGSGQRVADIGYNTFNIGSATNNGVIGAKSVNFNFGSSDQIALNRVTLTGAAYASNIYGAMTQSGTGGTVLLINPNGILFGPASSVNVNSFVASTWQVKKNELEDDGEIKLQRSGNPAGIYFEGPGNIATAESAVFLSNAIYNKNKNISAGSNLILATGDGTELVIDGSGHVDFEDGVGIDAVRPTEASQASIVLPNNVSVQLGSITSGSRGRLTTSDLTVIAEMNKNLQTQFKDIVNISSVIDVGSAYIYADNEMNDSSTNGKLNIITSAIKTNGTSSGDVYITADGKITVNGDITTNGDVFLGTLNLFNEFGPTQLQADNMAQDYVISGLIGDAIKTGSIFADDIIAIGKSIEMKDINADTAVLLAAESLVVDVNNTEYPFGLGICYQGGSIKLRNVDTENFIAVGSSIKATKIESDFALLAAIKCLGLDLAYDLSIIDLETQLGCVDTAIIDTDVAIVLGSALDLGYVEADNVAALLAIDSINLQSFIDPSILNIDISPFFTGILTQNSLSTLGALATNLVLPTQNLVDPLGFIDINVNFVNGTLAADTVETDIALLLGKQIDIDSVVADDLAVILGIDAANFHFDTGAFLPETFNFESTIAGGTINIGDIYAPTAIEIGASINNDSVTSNLFAAIAIDEAEFNLQFTADNVFSLINLSQNIVSLVDNQIDNQAYLSASLSATNGTIDISSITANLAVLLGADITTDYLDVDNLIKIKLPSIDISFNPQEYYSYDI